jgi:hypothetical protein
VLSDGKVLLDLEGQIQDEYHRHLNPNGAPGVGDRFYLAVLQSAPKSIERVSLPRRLDGEFADMPQSLIEAGFDPSDRKFAALANKEEVPVYNATDSDWLNHADTLTAAGIEVYNLCGCDATLWFVAN